jgi:poly(beta-D-mannuronate) lyase
MKSLVVLAIGLLNLAGLVAGATERKVSSAAEISQLADHLKPGDVLVMVNGVWTNQNIVLKAHGASANPAMLRAETPGKVILTGETSLTIDGEYGVVSGLLLKDGRGQGDGVKVAGRSCRLTDCAIEGGVYKFYVHLYGMSNRVDHCYLAGKTNVSPTMQIEAESQPNFHRVDHNHFGLRPPLRKNGGETIRVGYSHQSMSNSCTIVEENLFDQCDGEIEIISNKSCENTYRFNTFLDCAGMLTLRHGNRCVVEGNFFIAHHKRGSGGIRIIGEDHTIINNYIDGVRNGGFWITSGISNSPLNGYFQARNCLIAFNSFVDSDGPALLVDAGFGSSRRSLRPEKITIANNLFSVLGEEPLLKGREGRDFTWAGNLAAAKPADYKGVSMTDLRLEPAQDGLWRPGKDSPARGAVNEGVRSVKTDMDGQPRAGKLDVGADQISVAPLTRRPLTKSDVGPAWRK